MGFDGARCGVPEDERELPNQVRPSFVRRSGPP